MAYKVLVKDGQGFEAADARQARAYGASRNGVETDQMAVFKNGDDFYFTSRANRDYFKAAIEKETGIASLVCTMDKFGVIKVW